MSATHAPSLTCFLAQRLGVGAGAVDHDDEVVGLCRLLDYADWRVNVLVRLVGVVKSAA